MTDVLPKTMVELIALTKRGYLKFGDAGDDVKAAQKVLAVLGYDLKGTGYYGDATKLAVDDVQEKAGLRVDGELGEVTAKAIDLILGMVGSDAGNAGGTDVKVSPIADQDPLWVTAALKMLGTREVAGSGNNPTILEWAKEEGGAVAQNYRADSTAWCALAANHVLTKAGLRGTETLWALDFNSSTAWPNVKLSGPARGAFAPMKRNGGGHIIVVMGRTADGHLAAWGGNQSDNVTINSIPKDRPLSFRWPAGVALPKRVGFENLPIVKSDGRTTKES